MLHFLEQQVPIYALPLVKCKIKMLFEKIDNVNSRNDFGMLYYMLYQILMADSLSLSLISFPFINSFRHFASSPLSYKLCASFSCYQTGNSHFNFLL